MPVVGGIDTKELQVFIRKAVQDQIVAIEAKVDGFGHTVSAFETKLFGLGKLVETKAGAESLKSLEAKEVKDFESLQTSLRIYVESVQSVQESLNSLQAQGVKDFELLHTSLQTSFDTLSGELARLKESVHNPIKQEEKYEESLQSSFRIMQESLKSLEAKEVKDFESLQASLQNTAESVKSLESLHDSSQTSFDTLRGELVRLQEQATKVNDALARESVKTINIHEQVKDALAGQGKHPLMEELSMGAALASKADVVTVAESLITESDLEVSAEEIPSASDRIPKMSKILQARRKPGQIRTSSFLSPDYEEVTDESHFRGQASQADRSRKFGYRITNSEIAAGGAVLDDTHQTALPIPIPSTLLQNITTTNLSHKTKTVAYMNVSAEGGNLSSQAAVRFSPRPHSAPSSGREISPRKGSGHEPSVGATTPRLQMSARKLTPPSSPSQQISSRGQVDRLSSPTSVATYAGSAIAGHYTPTKFPIAISSYEPHQMRRSNSAPSVSSRGATATCHSASLPWTSQLSQLSPRESVFNFSSFSSKQQWCLAPPTTTPTSTPAKPATTLAAGGVKKVTTKRGACC